MRLKVYDTHVHCSYCKHATGHFQDYIEQGIKRGLGGIIFTDHAPMESVLSQDCRMSFEQIDEYIDNILSLKKEYSSVIDIALGIECDYLPDDRTARDIERLLDYTQWDYFLGSLHAHLPDYHDRHFTCSIIDFQKQYLIDIVKAAKSGFFDALAHLDLIKNINPESWCLEDLWHEINIMLDDIAFSNVAVELNTSGLLKCKKEYMPGVEILREIIKRDISITLGSDAHSPDRVGDSFCDALNVLKNNGCETVLTFSKRNRIPIKCTSAIKNLKV
ncbi:MAG: histidinol-phosphatase [Deltaproteobacteria bacterium]|nr:histidinol-phosphatase [Deltaproteobacteria bacterium]